MAYKDKDGTPTPRAKRVPGAKFHPGIFLGNLGFIIGVFGNYVEIYNMVKKSFKKHIKRKHISIRNRADEQCHKQSERMLKLWRDDTGKFKEYRRKRIQCNKEYVDSYLSQKNCAHCGLSGSICLDFHSIEAGKTHSISKMVRRNSLKCIKDEISRSMILCYNCYLKKQPMPIFDARLHSKESARSFGKKLARSLVSKKLWDYKSAHPCIQCGESDPRCLSFHHRDPSKKEHNISSLKRCSWELIKVEIVKCDILCGNCHRKVHEALVVASLANELLGKRGVALISFPKNKG